MKVLLVEEDQSTSEYLTAALKAHHYLVDLAFDGQTGLELANLWDYDIIVLDIELPKLDGLSLCRQLRAQGNNTFILILTACDEKYEISTGLDAGADDYVIKPCDPAQLIARIRALLVYGNSLLYSSELTWGALSLNRVSAEVIYKQQPIVLREQEYRLLELFMRYPQQFFTRSAILDHLCEVGDCPSENAVIDLIKNIQRKLKEGGMKEDLIETLYGLGYHLKDAPANLSQGQKKAEKSKEEIEKHEGIAQINELRQKFRLSLRQRILNLEKAVQLLQRNELSLEQRQQAQEEAHRLVGSLGTYGYEKGSQLARAIETLLKIDSGLKKTQINQLNQLITQLNQLDLSRNPECTLNKQEFQKFFPRGVLVNSSAQELNRTAEGVESPALVLTLGLDSLKALTLEQQALIRGLQVKSFAALTTISDQLALNTPSVILFKLKEANDQELIHLRQLKQQFPSVPLVILADQDSFVNRIEAARFGSQRYLQEPITANQVLDTITQLLPQPPVSQARVLIVDDDPTILMALKNQLHPWGLNVTCLSESSRFWEVLIQTKPDLLLLDLEMPSVNGLDICRVVRQDFQYGNLPILVVTAHTEIEYIQQAFEAGADDFIRKPIIHPELVVRVLSRIERARLRQQLDELRQQQAQIWHYQSQIDTLTQIANRRQFDERLAIEWQRHCFEQVSLALIMADVDYFKRYNDCYGHLAGNICLQQIASTLKDCIRSSIDLVARYGGEEFCLILPNSDLNGALQVAERIQSAIAQLQISHSDSSVSQYVTMTMGVTATIPTAEKTIEQLITHADRALYTAKAGGRNTYYGDAL